jgi:hypothetical protein
MPSPQGLHHNSLCGLACLLYFSIWKSPDVSYIANTVTVDTAEVSSGCINANVCHTALQMAVLRVIRPLCHRLSNLKTALSTCCSGRLFRFPIVCSSHHPPPDLWEQVWRKESEMKGGKGEKEQKNLNKQEGGGHGPRAGGVSWFGRHVGETGDRLRRRQAPVEPDGDTGDRHGGHCQEKGKGTRTPEKPENLNLTRKTVQFGLY